MKVTELKNYLNNDNEIKKLKRELKRYDTTAKIVLNEKRTLGEFFVVSLEVALFDEFNANYENINIENWSFYLETQYINFCPILDSEGVGKLKTVVINELKQTIKKLAQKERNE